MTPSRSVGPTLAIIACANGALLAGLLWFGWAPGTAALLFWFESACIGAGTLARIAASLPGYVPHADGRARYVRLPLPGGSSSARSSVPQVGRIAAIPLFIALYGTLLAVFAAMLVFSLKVRDIGALVQEALASGSVRLALLLIVAEHAWAFWREYVHGPVWARSDPTFHFWRPFGFAFVLWLAFFFGFLLFGWWGSPLPLLVALVVLKATAQTFGAVMDSQAGEWQPAGAGE